MKSIDACFSKNTDDWKTPTILFDRFMKLGFIDCFKFRCEYNELENNYENKKLFINPPFSKLNFISDWIIKQTKNNLVFLLIPSRTDTKYFQKFLELNPLLYFIKGRLHYNDDKSAPFPTVLLIFDNSKKYTFGTLGELLQFLNGYNNSHAIV